MTSPFSAAFEASLKEEVEGGKLYLNSGFVVNPRFFCCISGTSVGVDKDPVARLSVSPTAFCTNTAVTADYSNSYSPSSTINAWEITWGDGNTSNGVWPGAGTVNHPLGGYVLPGTYTITLTVTDLLGATGVDTQQVDVIDCTVVPDVIMIGACGTSGAWSSIDGGINWESFGLDGVAIYDLKTSPLTWATVDINLNVSFYNIIAWAAYECHVK